MAIRDYTIDDLGFIKKLMKKKLGFNDNIINSHMQGINFNDKIWIEESPDFMGFIWCKLRGDKMFIKLLYSENNVESIKNLLMYAESFCRVNNIRSIFAGETPLIEKYETIFLEMGYEIVKDPLMGRVLHKPL